MDAGLLTRWLCTLWADIMFLSCANWRISSWSMSRSKCIPQITMFCRILWSVRCLLCGRRWKAFNGLPTSIHSFLCIEIPEYQSVIDSGGKVSSVTCVPMWRYSPAGTRIFSFVVSLPRSYLIRFRYDFSMFQWLGNEQILWYCLFSDARLLFWLMWFFSLISNYSKFYLGKSLIPS